MSIPSLPTITLHFVVLLWGASGLVGDLASLPAEGLVFYRTSVAALVLAVWHLFSKRSVRLGSLRDEFLAMGTGIVLAAHWWFFFAAIKFSTISIGLICLSATPFFVVTVVRPLGAKARFGSLRLHEITISALCVVGLTMIFKFESGYTLGIVLGTLAALSDAIYSFLTSRLAQRYNASTLTLYQVATGSAVSTLAAATVHQDLSWVVLNSVQDVAAVLFLGVICTAVAMALFVQCLKSLPVFTAVLALNLEPVYGITLALLVLGESELMTAGFYAGALLLLVCVLADGVINARIAAAD